MSQQPCISSYSGKHHCTPPFYTSPEHKRMVALTQVIYPKTSQAQKNTALRNFPTPFRPFHYYNVQPGRHSSSHPLATPSLSHCCCSLCPLWSPLCYCKGSTQCTNDPYKLCPDMKPNSSAHKSNSLTTVSCPRGNGEQLISFPISQHCTLNVVPVLFPKEQIHISTSLLSQPHIAFCNQPPIPKTFSCYSTLPTCFYPV